MHVSDMHWRLLKSEYPRVRFEIPVCRMATSKNKELDDHNISPRVFGSGEPKSRKKNEREGDHTMSLWPLK